MREITGRKVLVFMVGAFGLIIAVNVLMAYKAISTFPGLEVENSYVASQTWDAENKAQKALGWTLTHAYDLTTRELRLTFADASGAPVDLASLEVLVGRTTEASEDQTPDFVRVGADYVARATLNPGKWMMRVVAYARDGTRFHQRIDLMVKG